MTTRPRFAFAALAALLTITVGCSSPAPTPTGDSSGFTTPATTPTIVEGEATPTPSTAEATTATSPLAPTMPPPTATTQGLPTSLDQMPRLDGSTAAIPLGTKVVETLAQVSQAKAEATTVFTGTASSYQAITQGTADLALSYEAPASIKEEIAGSGVPLDTIPIGRDALVFLVNKANPVTSLTQEQVRGIYTGTITNWNEVGGDNEPIIAFQRPEDSGSQTLMRDLAMGPTPMATPPTEQIPESMGQLIEAVASYDNSRGAIGFSVYYYATQMYAQSEIKLLAVEGVEPTTATIAAGDYPYVNDFYAVVRSSEPEESAARTVANWLLTEEGQGLVADSGYVPVG